jgi:hypothetical protein
LKIMGQPDGGEDGQAGQHRHDEEVLEEPQPGLGADDRDVEVALEERPEPLDDGGEEDGEAPEDGEVRRAGNCPLQKLALTENLGRHRLGALADAARATGLHRLPGAGQPVEHERTATGHGEHAQRDRQAEHESHDHLCLRNQG